MKFVFAATALSVVLVQPAFAGAQSSTGLAIRIDGRRRSWRQRQSERRGSVSGRQRLEHRHLASPPVDPNSDNLIASIGSSTGLHPDFGSGTYAHAIIGIPYVVVSDDQQPVTIKLKRLQGRERQGPVPRSARRADRRLEAERRKLRRRPARHRHRSRHQPPLRDVPRLPAKTTAAGKPTAGAHVPSRFRQRAPDREAGLDQRRRRGPADLSGPGAL